MIGSNAARNIAARFGLQREALANPRAALRDKLERCVDRCAGKEIFDMNEEKIATN